MKTFARSRWSLSIRSSLVVVAVVAIALGYGLARRRWAILRELAAGEEAREIAEIRSVERLRSVVAEHAAKAMKHVALADTDDADERGYRLKKVKEMAQFIAWASEEIASAMASAAEHASAKRVLLERW